MKIIHKAYFLVGILIAAAAVNLYLLVQSDQEATEESYAIIRAAELKVNLERINALGNNIAMGVEDDRENFDEGVKNFTKFLNSLEPAIPDRVVDYYSNVKELTGPWVKSAAEVYDASEFSGEAFFAAQSILIKNWQLVVATDQIVRDLDELQREHREHKKSKEFSEDLNDLAYAIRNDALSITLGQGKDTTQNLIENKNDFDYKFGELLEASTIKEDFTSKEALSPIPQANAKGIRDLNNNIWEDTKNQITIIENNYNVGKDINNEISNLNNQTNTLSDSFDIFLREWTTGKQEATLLQSNIIQSLLVADVAVFFLVIVVIRQSLNPLLTISKGMSRVKEGIYGEKINYKGEDEIGELVNAFNVMSETIQQKTEEAQATDTAKDEFLSMITHELKTPLVPIQGYVDILLGEHLGSLTEKQRERLKIIKASSESLLRIISDLLDAQKLELGKLVVKKENHGIKDTIEKAVEALQPRAMENKITIKQNLEKEIILPYDPERIMQVLTNLLKNSLDAVKPETGLIEIFVEDSPNEVMIKIKDNGPGIPIEKQEDLFKKFYQVDTSLTREIGGSGLGLAICKGLIEGHGGKISADSAPGVGATFWFTLPKNN